MLLCPGCGGPDHDAVQRAGGNMGDIGENFLDSGASAYFESMDDGRLRRIFPSLQRLHLYQLDVSGSGVTDQSAILIARLENLHFLNVHNTSLTPKGLAQLHNLRRLETLRVGGSTWTKDDIDQLRASFPGVEVIISS
jgi:hypothetical protein